MPITTVHINQYSMSKFQQKLEGISKGIKDISACLRLGVMRRLGLITKGHRFLLEVMKRSTTDSAVFYTYI